MKDILMHHMRESLGKMLDSYTAAILSIVFTLNLLELVGKVLAALLTIILIIRGCIHISKATIERRTAKLEEQIQEEELKMVKEQHKKLVNN